MKSGTKGWAVPQEDASVLGARAMWSHFCLFAKIIESLQGRGIELGLSKDAKNTSVFTAIGQVTGFFKKEHPGSV